MYRRIGVWTTLWLVGGLLLTYFRDYAFSAPILFLIQLGIAVAYISTRWHPRPSKGIPPSFCDMWVKDKVGRIRVVFFIIAFGILLLVAYGLRESRWVGLASALPLPGLFALATLSVMQKRKDLFSLADTALLGPLLVIPFNWSLAAAITHVRAERLGWKIEFLVVVAFWVAAAAIVFLAVPAFARWRDSIGAKV